MKGKLFSVMGPNIYRISLLGIVSGNDLVKTCINEFTKNFLPVGNACGDTGNSETILACKCCLLGFLDTRGRHATTCFLEGSLRKVVLRVVKLLTSQNPRNPAKIQGCSKVTISDFWGLPQSNPTKSNFLTRKVTQK